MDKLTIELVPKNSWYTNLRTLISQSNWQKIRLKAKADAGGVCAICGDEGRLECHEVWEYDDVNYVQKLVGFVSLCPLCHHVKHIGRTWAVNPFAYDDAVKHFKKVNKCNQKAFEKAESEAFKIWRKRSKHDWKIDLGEWDALIKKE